MLRCLRVMHARVVIDLEESITYLENIDYLLRRYRYFLVDQFGVLHDGFTPYTGAVNALRAVKEAGARVIIISNSGKRSSANIARMNSLGFGDGCFDRLVSSGEVAWHLLQREIIGKRFNAGIRCYFLSNNNDRGAVEGLDVIEVKNLDEAQLILISGQHLDNAGLQALCKSLEIAVHNKVPCICTNPDKVAYAESGKVFSSGAVAEWYESQGGEVIWLGKPYREIYEYIFNVEGISNKQEVVCIGDSIEHDIVGGSQWQVDTVLVRTGINDHIDDGELEALFSQHQCVPSYIIPSFSRS